MVLGVSVSPRLSKLFDRCDAASLASADVYSKTTVVQSSSPAGQHDTVVWGTSQSSSPAGQHDTPTVRSDVTAIVELTRVPKKQASLVSLEDKFWSVFLMCGAVSLCWSEYVHLSVYDKGAFRDLWLLKVKKLDVKDAAARLALCSISLQFRVPD